MSKKGNKIAAKFRITVEDLESDETSVYPAEEFFLVTIEGENLTCQRRCSEQTLITASHEALSIVFNGDVDDKKG
jgi:hypothetical protein